ncbi:hypothetical protein E9993_07135 [Labilibacter sediminis]|nr:hypothetical protein E9993_07135 [Labilibacter sediminis]
MNNENDRSKNIEAELVPDSFVNFFENTIDQTLSNLNYIIDYISKNIEKQVWRIPIIDGERTLTVRIPSINKYLFLKSFIYYLWATPHFELAFEVEEILEKVILNAIPKN